MGEPAMKMSSQFKVFSNHHGCTVHISGMINENTDFGLLELGDAKVIIMDLEQVTSLNSMGLRNWLNWIKTVKSRMQFNFRNCPRAVVDQMNILHGFLPMGAVIESFFVPYSCASCSHEENYLATRGKDYMEGTVDVKAGTILPEKRPCPVCSASMEWDVLPEQYFSFLKYRK
jgi:anti-anti-sigma regulatory factor